DNEWATVGSSNLDPLSLSLNLEANLLIRDPGFNRTLRERLTTLIDHHCKDIDLAQTFGRGWLAWLSYLSYHVVRHFPRWASYLPEHAHRLMPAAESTVLVPTPAAADAQPWRWREMLQTAERQQA